MSTSGIIRVRRSGHFEPVFPFDTDPQTPSTAQAGHTPSNEGPSALLEPHEDLRMSYEYPSVDPNVPQGAGADLKTVPTFSRLWQTKPLPTIPEDTMGAQKSFSGKPQPGEYKPQAPQKAPPPAIVDPLTQMKMKHDSQMKAHFTIPSVDDFDRLTVYPQESSVVGDEKIAMKRKSSIYQRAPEPPRAPVYDQQQRNPQRGSVLSRSSEISTESMSSLFRQRKDSYASSNPSSQSEGSPHRILSLENQGSFVQPVSYKFPTHIRDRRPTQDSVPADDEQNQPIQDERYQHPTEEQRLSDDSHQYTSRDVKEYEPPGKRDYNYKLSIDEGYQATGDLGYPAPRDQGYQAPGNQEYQNPRDQRYQPPLDQGSQAPKDQGYPAPRDQGYPAPRDQGSQAFRDQGYQPPVDERYQTPRDQGYQPPVDQRYQAPRDQGYQGARDQGYQPPMEQSYQPSADQPAGEQRYRSSRDEKYRSSKDERYPPLGDQGYQRRSREGRPSSPTAPGGTDSTRASHPGSYSSQSQVAPPVSAGITEEEQRPLGGGVDRRAIPSVHDVKAVVDATERGQKVMVPQRRSLQVKVFRRVYTSGVAVAGSAGATGTSLLKTFPSGLHALPIDAVAGGEMDLETARDAAMAAVAAFDDTSTGQRAPCLRRVSRPVSRGTRTSVCTAPPPTAQEPTVDTSSPTAVRKTSSQLGQPSRGTELYMPKPMYRISGTPAAPYEVLVGKRLFAPPDEVCADDMHFAAGNVAQIRDDSVSSNDSYHLRATASVRPVARKFLTGSSFEGGWGPFNNPEQYGILILPHKVEYEGQFMDGMCHGEGALVYPNGARVMGIWNRGRLVEMTYVAANAQAYDPNGDYCNMPDRRFHREKLFGLRPACRSLLTDEEPPARPVPDGCFDAGDGIFDPTTNVVYDPITITVVRVPTATQREWIIKHCRKGWDENVGHRPDLFEEWVDEKPSETKHKKKTEDGKSESSPHFKMDRELSPSIGSVEETEEHEEVSPEEITQAIEQMEEPEVEEPPEKLLEKMEERFLQEEYPPAFTEDVLIRAPRPKDIDEMLFPDFEEESVEEEEKRRDAVKKLTERERKRALKDQKAKQEMSEEKRRELEEKERAEQEVKQKERERLKRLREMYTPKWPTAAKLMVPVLEEGLAERQERRRKMEEAQAREELRKKEMEEIQEKVSRAREERKTAESSMEMESPKEEEKEKKKKTKEKAKGEEAEKGASPRLSLDEGQPSEDYHGTWRHVAKRLVPQLRERIEGDREAAAAKWQEDLMQLLSERASTAGLEMSATGYLGATAPPPEEERKRGSSLRIFPPGLEERARKRRADREARELAEAREFASRQTKSPSLHAQMGLGGSPPSVSTAKPDRRGVSIAPPSGSVSGPSKKADRTSASSHHRVSISAGLRTSPPEDEAESHHGTTSAGPMPSIKTSISIPDRTTKTVRKIMTKEDDDDDDDA